MAKNHVSEINYKIHAAKRRDTNTDSKSCSKKRTSENLHLIKCSFVICTLRFIRWNTICCL